MIFRWLVFNSYFNQNIFRFIKLGIIIIFIYVLYLAMDEISKGRWRIGGFYVTL